MLKCELLFFALGGLQMVVCLNVMDTITMDGCHGLNEGVSRYRGIGQILRMLWALIGFQNINIY